nr:integrase, catalytic region, zinc finger, CCHC-type, peptidase aspartic, catalytic [Tanacetum cinerariifolium]
MNTLEEMFGDFGYIDGRLLFTRFTIPEESLDEGLVLLMYDEDVIRFLKYVHRFRELEMYIETDVLLVKRHMMEGMLSKSKGAMIEEIVEYHDVNDAVGKQFDNESRNYEIEFEFGLDNSSQDSLELPNNVKAEHGMKEHLYDEFDGVMAFGSLELNRSCRKWTDFASWKQRIQLYCRGKENGVNILKSINEGPFQMGTIRETLAEGEEGALHLDLLEGSELTKEDRESQLYDDFEHFRQNKGETIHDYYVKFTKLINDMRNIKMTMPKMQLNSKFVNNMLPEWGRFVTVVKLNIGLKESNYDQLYAYLKQHEAHANENKMMLERFAQHTVDPLTLMPNVSPHQNQATVQDGKVVVQNVQGRQNRGQGNNARETCAAGYGDYVIGDIVISRIYYVERLGHNLFSVGKFCDFDLEVAFRKHSCYVRDTNGVELIKGSRGSDLYTILVEDMLKSSSICLLSKASKNTSWLWHRFLNHLNFGTINDLARKDLVRGIPRLKFEKDHLAQRVN